MLDESGYILAQKVHVDRSFAKPMKQLCSVAADMTKGVVSLSLSMSIECRDMDYVFPIIPVYKLLMRHLDLIE